MSNKKDSSKSPRDTNGPVVKTGPTAGQNRSRNQDGQWRAKRSDAGQSKKKGGCFLTTAACHYKGLPDDCHELQVLRGFRDEYLLKTAEGTTLVDHYYSVAPFIAERLTDAADLEQVWQVIGRCVGAIEARHHATACALYEDMVRTLECRFSQAEGSTEGMR